MLRRTVQYHYKDVLDSCTSAFILEHIYMYSADTHTNEQLSHTEVLQKMMNVRKT